MSRSNGLPAPRIHKEFGDNTPDMEVPTSSPTHVIVPLLSLDPRNWREDKRKQVWRYYLDGGFQLVCRADIDTPDCGVIMHGGTVLCAIFWLENVDKKVVQDYWNTIGRVEGILNAFSDSNTQTSDQFTRLYTKIMGIEMAKEKGK